MSTWEFRAAWACVIIWVPLILRAIREVYL